MERRERLRKRLLPLASALLVILVLAYTVSTLTAAIPAASTNSAQSAAATVTIEEVELPWPAEPSSIAVWTDAKTTQGSGLRSNGNSAETVMASLAKLITIVVSLDAHPYDPNDEATYTLGAKDVGYYRQVLAQDGSTAPVVEGVKLTRYQMMQLMMLPSANNYALSYVDWIFGSMETFRKEAQAYFDKHKLESIRLNEPSGLDLNNVATASDLSQIGQLALAYPVLAEIMAQQTAEIPGIGTIKNSNFFLGESGVRGMKTGTTSAGRNLMLARDVTVGDRTVTFVITTLGQPSAEARIAVNEALIAGVAGDVQEVTVATDGEVVGDATLWNGAEVQLLVKGSASTVLTLDEAAKRKAVFGEVRAGMNAGDKVGLLNIATPTGKISLPVVLAESIPEPDGWWRLTHPFAVWGWMR